MVKALCLSACFGLSALRSVAGFPREVEAVFSNHSSRTFELEIFDSRGELAADTTLPPGAANTITVADGEARIYRPSKELSFGKPISSCRIDTKHAHGVHPNLHFEVRESKIAEVRAYR
jgi:hypothetical protein